MRYRSPQAGVTLLELVIVLGLIGLLAAISFPSVSAGLDSLRLNTACDQTASFLNAALDRAERRQQVVEVTISRAASTLTLRSTEAGFERVLAMPGGITILNVLPEVAGESEEAPRRVVLMPGGAIPRFGVELVDKRGSRRIVRVDPITGVPEVERPQ
ncbi:MAG: prepilin-type N-terminal cleavage/methylation domain-containing protein [Bryobacterales bacterium]|nr:prepilin-type N-terminal cleavage/methylation domain-containing protein [Bryobacterales bacterium]